VRILPLSVPIFLCLTATLSAGPFHDAVRDGDVVAIKQLLDKGAAPSDTDETGEPPLIIAALAGRPEVIALLVERGADVKVRNRGGLTALHAAAYAGNIDVVEMLVARGADVNDAGNFYHMTPLHGAAEEGHADVVAFLLAQKVDIEAKERNGYTPLTQAGWRSHWEAAELLLKAGASCQKAELVGDWLYAECMKRQ
jgi:ankyrin repeat protein